MQLFEREKLLVGTYSLVVTYEAGQIASVVLERGAIAVGACGAALSICGRQCGLPSHFALPEEPLQIRPTELSEVNPLD